LGFYRCKRLCKTFPIKFRCFFVSKSQSLLVSPLQNSLYGYRRLNIS
jgi:hypothetical protein